MKPHGPVLLRAMLLALMVGPGCDRGPAVVPPVDARGGDDAVVDAPVPVDAAIVPTACVRDADCLDPTTPVCSDGACTHLDQCIDDDAFEPGNDTAAGALAAPLALAPTATTPATAALSICSAPSRENDYVRVTLAEPASLTVRVDAAAGFRVRPAFSPGGGVIPYGDNRLATGPLAAGDYVVMVALVAPAGQAASVPYTVRVAYAECATDLDCSPAEPICGGGECVAGPAQCTGDDAAEPSDDGRAGATALAVAVGQQVARSGQVCGVGGEYDWFRIDVADGDALDLGLAWTDASHRLQLLVYDASLALVGMDSFRRPAATRLSYLPAGRYYVAVREWSPSTAATAYTLSVGRTAGACASALDCAADFGNQLHRGACAASGACRAIVGEAPLPRGAACDGNDDCASSLCSNEAFGAHAERDVCTVPCSDDAACAVMGPGFRCTTQFSQNYCKAACGSDLDCGTGLWNQGTPDPGQPWNYYTCDLATGACGD